MRSNPGGVRVGRGGSRVRVKVVWWCGEMWSPLHAQCLLEVRVGVVGADIRARAGARV